MIKLDGIDHRYGDHRALADVDLNVLVGVTALVGANGAGKSTLLSIVATLLRPTSGSVTLGERVWPCHSMRDIRDYRACVGFAPQTAELPANTTVKGFLSYVARMRGVPRADRFGAVSFALELADLAPVADRRCGELSGGMRKRVLVAQAILHRPQVVLFDEPMESLDPEQRIRLRSNIRSLAGDECAVVVSSHVLGDVVPIADRVVMLDEGAVVFDGTTADLEQAGRQALGTGSKVSPYEAAFMTLRRGR